ncbi:MAG: hypothetical protein ABJD68_01165 [Nakamurella sp.]
MRAIARVAAEFRPANFHFGGIAGEHDPAMSRLREVPNGTGSGRLGSWLPAAPGALLTGAWSTVCCLLSGGQEVS